MKRKLMFIFIAMCVMLAGTAAVSFAADAIDISALDKGVVKVSYASGSRLKVQISHGGNSKPYTYDLNNQGRQEVFPLQMGNGEYKVKVLENTGDQKYKVVASKDVTLSLADPNSVYLNPIQSIEWNVNPKSVAKAVELTSGTEDPVKKASILWNYMIKNNQYDYQKALNIPSPYFPVPDQTLALKMGICYDFSSLYAAMLRSEGIPAKLVKGYASGYATGYHAWNEVYDSAKKQWVVVDSTYDLQVYAKNPSIGMTKPGNQYQKMYEY